MKLNFLDDLDDHKFKPTKEFEENKFQLAPVSNVKKNFKL